MKQIIPFRKEIEFKTMITKITGISLEHTLSLTDEYTIGGDFIVSGTYKMTEASQIEEQFSYKVPVEINIDSKYDTKEITLDIDDFIYEVVDEEKLDIKIDLCIDNLIEKPIEVIDTFESFESIAKKDEEIEELKDLSSTRNDDIEDLFLETSKKEDLSIDEQILQPVEEHKEELLEAEQYNNIPTPILDQPNVSDQLAVEQPMNLNNPKTTVESIFSAFSNTDETFSTYCVYIVRENDTVDSIISKYKTNRDLLAEYNNLKEIKIGSKIIIPNYQDE